MRVSVRVRVRVSVRFIVRFRHFQVQKIRRSARPYFTRGLHRPTILAAHIIYSTHPVLLVWIIVAIFTFVVYWVVVLSYKIEQFDGQCVFAVAADGDDACFSSTFWTV